MYKFFCMIFLTLPIMACQDHRVNNSTAETWAITYLPKFTSEQERQALQKYIALKKELNGLSQEYCKQQEELQKEQEKLKTDVEASLVLRKSMNIQRATRYSVKYREYKSLVAELEFSAVRSEYRDFKLEALMKLQDFVPNPSVNISEEAAEIDQLEYERLMAAIKEFLPRDVKRKEWLQNWQKSETIRSLGKTMREEKVQADSPFAWSALDELMDGWARPH